MSRVASQRLPKKGEEENKSVVIKILSVHVRMSKGA